MAEGPEDPRPELARFLVETCAGARAIVAYNAGYEAECLRQLTAPCPSALRSWRMPSAGWWTCSPPSEITFTTLHFDGSFSLKQVLPALVPDLCYDGMDVAEGRTASRELAELLFEASLDPQERSVIREGLLAYCKQDTWAMVCLLRKLRELALGG